MIFDEVWAIKVNAYNIYIQHIGITKFTAPPQPGILGTPADLQML